MSNRSPITTHVLDTAQGRPAAGLSVTLARRAEGEWVDIASGETNADGRVEDLLPPGSLLAGEYRLCFETGSYLLVQSDRVFYRAVAIEFVVDKTDEHYHVPLLLSPFGYSTYRGS